MGGESDILGCSPKYMTDTTLAAAAVAHMGTVCVIFDVVGAAAPLTSLFIVLHTALWGPMGGES